ncbi:NAD(P)/FAD-dependent oxidoreductase [Aliicoccus persicus]|uniref:D-amino-acid dehydrogenase n=1 Tax=Aliicoccus persicus TaxID=930138 RepID=A0A662Z6M6_9STAP|nr:FAD-dependent oxidoreductase [Aliicoccus persicus]SEW12392.1 D-amino-acid dehydrogenase [Aliicoccus persicus]
MKKYTIVGGGIIGASVAYHLQKYGADITVYDRDDAGKASRASAGIIAPWISQRRNKKWYRLAKTGAAYYPSFIEALERDTQLDTGYQQKGVLSLFRDNNVLQKGYKRISSKMEDAPEMQHVEIIERDKIRTYHPTFVEHFPAVYTHGGAQVNGAKLNSAIKESIIKNGGTWKNEDFQDDRVEGEIIYTTGAWGIEQGFKPTVSHQRAEVYHFEVESDFTTLHNPVVMALGPIYIVEMSPNQFAIGTTHEDTTSFSTMPSHENYKYLKSLAEEYFSGFKIRDIGMNVGLRPHTRDFLPFIGRVAENKFVINGMGSTGLTAGPIVGAEVARLLNNVETELDLSDYSYIN